MKYINHTPGPWGAENDIICSDSGDIARLHFQSARPEKEWKANARLIATAPDLLFAAKCALADLEGIMPEFEPSGDREHPAWNTIKQLKKAIKKGT